MRHADHTGALREILAGFDTAPGADPSHHKRNYGWFHQWLMGIRQSPEFEPIRAVVRTHIAGAAPWRAGRVLLGAEVDKGDLHSMDALATRLDLTWSRANRVTKALGLGRAWNGRTYFTETEARAAEALIARHITRKEAARRLGVSIERVIRLTAEGILQRQTLGWRLSYHDAEQIEQIRRGRDVAVQPGGNSSAPAATKPCEAERGRREITQYPAKSGAEQSEDNGACNSSPKHRNNATYDAD
ncbi:hypothetical protein [Amaricoccus sp. W119]|uniref:hypothetical protein n=1 Tax=Amaricoccus sp. W119 TaxID=3391833 RepID=UPI0039A5E162